jgi:hypothetical protein
MRMVLAAVLILMTHIAASADAINGKEIEAVLNDTTVYGLPLARDSWRQSFSKGGETIYIDASGAKTFGQWLTRGDKYCSLWPPSDRWVCYPVESGVTADGKATVTWVSGGGGKRFEALLTKGLHVDEPAPVK